MVLTQHRLIEWRQVTAPGQREKPCEETMSKSTKTTPEVSVPRETQTTPSNLAFKAIALPALAAAARRKAPGRAARRVGLVLDPARYTD
jgi:hypothetical protein